MRNGAGQADAADQALEDAGAATFGNVSQRVGLIKHEALRNRRLRSAELCSGHRNVSEQVRTRRLLL